MVIEKNAKLVHFLFLDSFRGLMAIIICIAHVQKYLGNPNKDDIMDTAQKLATPLGLPGFFILSSFLLTYRFLAEVSNSNAFVISKTLFLIIAKYFIRRFFRIYIVFFIYCTIWTVMPKFYEGSLRDHMLPAWASWFELITLSKSGRHLWTISIEIYYYFFIPILCILFVRFNLLKKQYKIQVLFLFVIICYYGSFYNLFGVSDEIIGKEMYIVISTNMKLSFFVFLSGSVLGLIYHAIENNGSVIEPIMKNIFLQRVLNLTSILWCLYAYRKSLYNGGHYKILSGPGFLWAVFLIILLLSDSEKNLIKKFLEKSSVLKSFGKFSFGVYLLHPLVIFICLKTDLVLTFIRSNLRSPELYAIILFISYLLGYLWYRFVEEPMINQANKICHNLIDYFNKSESQIVNHI